jgi:hypothetical protein
MPSTVKLELMQRHITEVVDDRPPDLVRQWAEIHTQKLMSCNAFNRILNATSAAAWPGSLHARV